jgi:hypothetical protein
MTSTKEDSLPDLHPESPEGLSLLPKSKWNEYDHAIWDQFEELFSESVRGEPPGHVEVAIGRLEQKPVLVTQAHYSEELNEMSLFDGITFPRELVVSGNVFCYPETLGEEGIAAFDDWIIIYQNVLASDGTYDIFKDKIPKEHFWCVREMLNDEDGGVYPDGEEPFTLSQFIKQEVGDPSKIVDPQVREFVSTTLAKSSSG